MRLINVKKFLSGDDNFFKTWDGQGLPQYAIISHRWEAGEVNFNEMSDPAELPSLKQRPGYRKVKSACEQAKNHSLDWFWIDTCCIDKSSSAELQEAINSMFRYYQDAEECYVYLSDLPSSCPQISDYDRNIHSVGGRERFCESVWFKRGWTLQELLAPRRLSFYSWDWTRVAQLEDLVTTISSVTNIDADILLHMTPMTEVAVAKRMSWAADRSTTRIEDRAYSLLGIFDVNMPMLYGEGEKAFRRLQLEILRTSTDQSLLVHSYNSSLFQDIQVKERFTPEILAISPSHFADSGDVVVENWNGFANAFEMTNAGMRLSTHLIPKADGEYHVAILNCRYKRHHRKAIGLRLLKQVSTTLKDDDDLFGMGYTMKRYSLRDWDTKDRFAPPPGQDLPMPYATHLELIDVEKLPMMERRTVTIIQPSAHRVNSDQSLPARSIWIRLCGSLPISMSQFWQSWQEDKFCKVSSQSALPKESRTCSIDLPGIPTAEVANNSGFKRAIELGREGRDLLVIMIIATVDIRGAPEHEVGLARIYIHQSVCPRSIDESSDDIHFHEAVYKYLDAFESEQPLRKTISFKGSEYVIVPEEGFGRVNAYTVAEKSYFINNKRRSVEEETGWRRVLHV